MRNIKTLLLVAAYIIAMAFSNQSDITIQGIVLDEIGDPLIGASVQVIGQDGTGAATDIDGSFSIIVAQLPIKLRIAFIGFETQEIEVKNASKTLNIHMLENLQSLDEVIIVDLGERREKKAQANSASTINGHKLRGVSTGNYRLQQESERIYPHGDRYHRSFNQGDQDAESYADFQENPFIRPTDEALSTFSVDVDRASYSNIRRYIKAGQIPPKNAVRIEEMINYFKYDYPEPTGKDPVSIQSTWTECPWNKEHHLLHIGLQAKRIPTDDLPPSNFVFLIDVSGSMNNFNKLPLVKSSMKLLLNQLRPADRVAIVTYAGADKIILASTPATEKYTILEAIENLDSGGSTAGARGIQSAYKIARANFLENGNNRIILATDGDFNVGLSSNEALKSLIEKERKSGVFLSILAYGMGNYKDDLMQTLAQAGNGNHAYIDDLQEAQKTLINEFGSTLFTVAKDVKIQIEFNPGKVSAYRLVGYETRMLEKEDFNNDKKDAGDMGSGHSVTAIYEIIPEGSKSTYFGKVDPLKYQKEKKNIALIRSDEIATIKFRYKPIDSDTSKKIDLIVNDFTNATDADNDVNWAIATAAFGMKLRGSEHIAELDYDSIIEIAKRSKGIDNEGFRSELIRLIRSTKGLSTEYVVSNK